MLAREEGQLSKRNARMTRPDRGLGMNNVDLRGIASPALATAKMPASGAGFSNNAIAVLVARQAQSRCRVVFGFDHSDGVGHSPQLSP